MNMIIQRIGAIHPPEEILLFGKRYKVKFWRDILFILIEELYKIDKELINRLVYNKDFKGRKRLYITYDKIKQMKLIIRKHLLDYT